MIGKNDFDVMRESLYKNVVNNALLRGGEEC